MEDQNEIWETTGRHKRGKHCPTVFVSASVYDKKDLLEQLYALLRVERGYDVRMSFKGTIPVSWMKSAFQNCEDAVDDSDLFIGIISPSYGSGVDSKNVSITQREMRRARDRQKPRILLVDERVMFLREFLAALGYKHTEGRMRFRKALNVDFAEEDAYLRAKHVCDLRALDLYDEMVLGVDNDPKKPIDERIGNWIQPYADVADFGRYVAQQLSWFQAPERYHGTADAIRLIAEKVPDVRCDNGRGAR